MMHRVELKVSGPSVEKDKPYNRIDMLSIFVETSLPFEHVQKIAAQLFNALVAADLPKLRGD